jgi:hypothetical protein
MSCSSLFSESPRRINMATEVWFPSLSIDKLGVIFWEKSERKKWFYSQEKKKKLSSFFFSFMQMAICMTLIHKC